MQSTVAVLYCTSAVALKTSVVPRQRVDVFHVAITLLSDVSLCDCELSACCNANGLCSL